MRGAVVTLLLCILAREGIAQSVSPLAGTHRYGVRGFFQGDEMEPWDAELSIRDTIAGVQRAYSATYRSRFVNGAWQHTYSFLWRDTVPLGASWVNDGRRAKNECAVSFAAGKATAVADGKTIGEGAPGVPDFALGAYLSSRTLRAGETLSIPVIRCLPDGPAPFTSRRVTATVAVDSTLAVDGARVPVWVVTGAAEYPFVATIGGDQRRVLSFKLPQGTVGHQLDTYRP
jgi:hypothetical protein